MNPSATNRGRLPARGLGFALVGGALALLVYLSVSDAPSTVGPEERAPSSAKTPSGGATKDSNVPAYFEDPEALGPFPALVPPSRYDHPVVSRAYAIAQEIPAVLAQQPCYCYCDSFGHRSLLDCWASDHGAG